MSRVPRTPRDSTILQEIDSKSLREFYRWMVEVTTKLEGTDTTLADEEKKSITPLIGMINEIGRRLDSLDRGLRSNKGEIASLQRLEQENRTLRAQILALTKRIDTIEGEL